MRLAQHNRTRMMKQYNEDDVGHFPSVYCLEEQYNEIDTKQ